MKKSFGKIMAVVLLGVLLLLGLCVLTPLGKILRDRFIASRDQALFEKAETAWDAGRFEEARDDCGKILEMDQKFLDALVLLGKYYSEKAEPLDWGKAAQYEERALMVRRDYPILLAYGGALWKNKEYSKAGDILRECLADNPGDASVYDQLGWVLIQQGKAAQAAEVYGEGLKNFPGNAKLKAWRKEALRRKAGPSRAGKKS